MALKWLVTSVLTYISDWPLKEASVSTKKKIHLLAIDPQIDFTLPTGSLFVPGADKDMERLSKFINRVGSKLDDIHVTLDCHRVMDIAHPGWWKDSAGNHPKPFTILSRADVEAGVWTTTVPSYYKRALDYVKALEKNGKYPLCIWPEHCLIGSPGNNVHPSLQKALTDWEREQVANVDFVTKGSNPFTEHYSPLQADVPDAEDPSTQLNVEFVRALEEADLLVIAGEAGSHCLANCVRDLAANATPELIKKIVLLRDATSPVPGFEKFQDEMISDMTKLGMKISTTTEFLV